VRDGEDIAKRGLLIMVERVVEFKMHGVLLGGEPVSGKTTIYYAL